MRLCKTIDDSPLPKQRKKGAQQQSANDTSLNTTNVYVILFSYSITAFVSLMLHFSLLLYSCPVCVLPLVALQTHENGLSATNLLSLLTAALHCHVTAGLTKRSSCRSDLRCAIYGHVHPLCLHFFQASIWAVYL